MHSYALIHTMETFALGYTHPTPGRHKPYPKGGNTLWQRKNATWQSVESTVAVPPPPKSTLNCLIGTCLTKCSSSIPCWVLSIASIRINPWIQLNWRPKLKCWRQHFSRCGTRHKNQGEECGIGICITIMTITIPYLDAWTWTRTFILAEEAVCIRLAGDIANYGKPWAIWACNGYQHLQGWAGMMTAS